MNFVVCRNLNEIKESERRARTQAEVLKSALDEHSLELRVKAANEAEAACQQRLSATEAEIAELRAKLDASERLVAIASWIFWLAGRSIFSFSYGQISH